MNISNRMNQTPLNFNKVKEIKGEIVEAELKPLGTNNTEGPQLQKPSDINLDVKVSNEQILLNNGIKIVSSNQKPSGTQSTGTTRGTPTTEDVDEIDKNEKLKDVEKEEEQKKIQELEAKRKKEENITKGVMASSAIIGAAVGGTAGAVIGLMVGIAINVGRALFKWLKK